MGNIAQANKMIVFVDSVNDPALTEAERRQFKAEAKSFAMIYFDMVRIWGNVPLVTSVAGDITSETVEEVYPAYFPRKPTRLPSTGRSKKTCLKGCNARPITTRETKRNYPSR